MPNLIIQMTKVKIKLKKWEYMHEFRKLQQ